MIMAPFAAGVLVGLAIFLAIFEATEGKWIMAVWNGFIGLALAYGVFA